MASSDPILAFRVDADDNTAVVLADVSSGTRVLLCGDGKPEEILAREDIPSGHKIALADLPLQAPVLRYGCQIGETTRPVRRGDWVHLQNCRSLLDERSGGFDPHSGAAKDTPYA